jgi:membrane-associated phospholipid phosphatase
MASLWSAMPLRRRVLLVVIIGGVISSAAIFLKVGDSVRESEVVVRVDENVLDFVVRHRSDWLSQTARVVTTFGSGWIIAAVVVVSASILLRRRRPADALFTVASVVGTAIAVAITKHFVGRPRPAVSQRLVTVTGPAFPSGHAAQSVACYAALAVVVVIASRSRTVRALAIAGSAAVAVAVGASRIVLGVHWLSDVVSGWLLAAGWLLALIGLRVAFEGSPKLS